ncbi:MAG TPA: M20/M25/M40 family metallo-hydrolase [Chloroflexota bacterium]|nr:M20/M25/M40 family metallo-hydrolase [Chloroflexota bacterium]
MHDQDWKAAGDDLIRHLQTLLRFETVNPPGDERPCIDYIAETLRSAGYEPIVLDSAPGRGNVVARRKGTGEKPPLLIYSHVDVVPVEAEKWTHPAFGGEIADGCVWGRGALDMKDMVALELQTMCMLAESDARLERDVIFAATADEEDGGHMGAQWLVENRPELVRAEFGLSEGAGTTEYVGDRAFYGIRTAEKGTSRFRIRVEGEPGHGSIPRQNTAIHRLAKAVCSLYEHRLPIHLTETSRGFLTTMAEMVRVPLEDPITDEQITAVAQKLPEDVARSLQATVRNTATPTQLQAGSRINVIPGVAEAGVDARLVPGQTPADLEREVRAIVGPETTIEFVDSGNAQEVPPRDELYRTIENAVKRHAPDALVLPVMLSGATDARWISKLGTRCLGFSPVKLPPDFPSEGLVHGHDERVPVDGLTWGLRVFYEVVSEFAGAKAQP